MPKTAAISAILPAAGLSSRMKAYKPLLPLGEGTLLSTAIRAFKDCGIRDIRVVTGFREQDLVRVILEEGAIPVPNPGYQQGMFSSVQAGISSLDSRCEAFFVLPADIPLVRPSTLATLMAAFFRDGGIVYPVFQGIQGHPPLISSRFRRAVLDWPGQDGLRGCLMQFQAQSRDVPVCDRAIHMDADTPGAYDDLIRYRSHSGVPDPDECDCLLAVEASVKPAVIRHGQAVARVALMLADALGPDLSLDRDLIRASALVHDLAKGRPDHAGQGARLLRRLGFDRVAGCVETHMDLETGPATPLDESQILFLADKLVVKDSLELDMDSRFNLKLTTYRENPGAREAILRRRETARIIMGKVEARAGCTLGHILLGGH
ncbi:MAG: NTP transferase domain-containing protein [Pseudomonadota bacterium]